MSPRQYGPQIFPGVRDARRDRDVAGEAEPPQGERGRGNKDASSPGERRVDSSFSETTDRGADE